jgi:hypothetical protein
MIDRALYRGRSGGKAPLNPRGSVSFNKLFECECHSIYCFQCVIEFTLWDLTSCENFIAFGDADRRYRQMVSSAAFETLCDLPIKDKNGIITLGRTDRHLQKLLDYSNEDSFAFDVALFISTGSGNFGRDPMSYALSEWLNAAVNGNITRPKRKGNISGRNLERYNSIYNVLQSSSEYFKIPVTRNDATLEISICDAVSSAMILLKLEPSSFKTIKAIWSRGRPKRPRLPWLDHP